MASVMQARPHLRAVRTAHPSRTIWSEVSEDAFRRHLVALEERTNAVPIDVITAEELEDNIADDASGSLPLFVEKQLVDDLAYLAAVTEGAQSVAAVCLEQHISSATDTPTLVLRVAGMDVVDENVKQMLNDISGVLQHVAIKGQECDDLINTIFTTAVRQHQQKLLGRLRSKKWIKPKYLSRTHKKPLWRDFENVKHRAQHVYERKSERNFRDLVTNLLTGMEKEYAEYEDKDDDADLTALKHLVRATYDICKLPEIAAYAGRLENATSPTPQVKAVIKTLRQLEKIGAYWRIAVSLVAVAKLYPASFRRIHLEYVNPYVSAVTDIAYESWAKTMHVHAEVQLVVEYALREQAEQPNVGRRMIRPRNIGTSKYLCYLCYLFLSEHGIFGHNFSSHGRLYDQWTVPDLEEYDTQVKEKLAEVLATIDTRIVKQLEKVQGSAVWRTEPMTSRQNLIPISD